MKVQNALKESGMAINEKISSYSYVAIDNDGDLRWYSRRSNEKLYRVTFEHIWDENFQPYHEVKEIVPENAGELWESTRKVWVTYGRNSLYFMSTNDGSNGSYGSEPFHEDIIHGKNGWKLLHSPDKEVMDRIKEVEDESVERIVIKDVTWHKGFGNGVAVVVPVANNGRDSEEVGPGLLTRGPMTMILEMSKDKP